jgi:hypothetical protein
MNASASVWKIERFWTRWGAATLSAAWALAACPEPEPEPEPEPQPEASDLRFVVVDGITEAPVEECLVGETVEAAVTTGEDGVAALAVARGASVHVLCEGAVLRSFRLPDVDVLDWTVPVDRGGSAFDPETWCMPNVEFDGSALGIASGDGSLEIRVLTAERTGRYGSAYYPLLNLEAYLAVPPGDYEVLARAYGGEVAGFARSGTLNCPGDGAAPDLSLALAPLSVTSRNGTWAGLADADSYDLALRRSAGGVGGWYGYRVDHSLLASDTGFTVEMADGIGEGGIDLDACAERADGAEACVTRVGVAESGTLDVGALPGFVAADLVLCDDGTVSGGGVSGGEFGADSSWNAELWSEGDFVFTQHWDAWSSGSLLPVVPAGWFEAAGMVPAPANLELELRGRAGVVFDWTAGWEPVERPDGWTSYRAADTPISPEDCSETP